MNQKPLCYAPFIGIYASSYDSYAPCCVSKKFKFSSAEQYWNSDQLKQIRLQLSNGQWPDSCSYCSSRAEKDLKNDVVIWDKEYSKNNIKISIEFGNQTNFPMYTDYRPSNVCNLKCRMCVPQASNQIEKEVIDNNQLLEWYSLPKPDQDNLDSFLEFTKKCNIKKIKILGGEPTIDEKTIKFLEQISYKNPILRFTTNGTNLNKRFRDIMYSYDQVEVSFSVDAAGKTYEYIRTNSNWNKTSRQIERIFKEDLASVYGFNVVLMPYNIFNITSLLDWFYTLYCSKYKFYLYFDNSDIPHTSLSAVLPNDIKQTIEDIEMWLFNKKDFVKVEGVTQLVKILENVKFNQKDHNDFKKFNNALDNIRKTNLVALDSRFEKYI